MDNLRTLLLGDDPRTSKGTRAVFKFNDQKTPKNPSKPRILSMSGDTVTCVFSFPARCPVGQWKLNLEVSFKDKDGYDTFWHKIDDVYVLFNPWEKGE